MYDMIHGSIPISQSKQQKRKKAVYDPADEEFETKGSRQITFPPLLDVSGPHI